MPVLHFVATASPPTAQLPGAAALLRAVGWDVWVTATPNALAMEFLDRAAVEEASGNPVRVEAGTAGQRTSAPAPDAVAAVVTLNSLSKWAVGINDSRALGVLQESLGAGITVVAGVWAKERLRAHPAFDQHIETLTGAGVAFLPPGSGYGPYDWETLRDRLGPAGGC